MSGTGSAVWLDVLPAMNKLAPNMTKGATVAAKKAGTAAGRQFSSSLAAGAAGGGGAKALVTELEAASKQAQRIVQNEKTAIYQARNAEKVAAQGVQVAEQRLAAARAQTGAAAQQTAAAEQLVAARRGTLASATTVVAQRESALAALKEKNAAGSSVVMRAEKSLATAREMAGRAAATVTLAEADVTKARSNEISIASKATAGEAALTKARGAAGAASMKTATVENTLREAYRGQAVIQGQLGKASVLQARQAAVMNGVLAKQAALGAPVAAGMSKIGGGIKSITGASLGVVRPLASMAAGFGAIVGIGKVITLGNQYTASMNELGAVTNSTATQMVKAGKVSRQLGSDLTLPATSGADAAAIMVELAKGGLSLQSSMIAAKGTIQLAAAAQIDGAQAATIQANALNQFGLGAKSASMVADVLANTANAASGEITDMATALKYVGPSARGLGVNITQTGAAIGLLAKNGILADTAGTSLRTMMVSLAKPTKKGAMALDDLGISAFDAQGNFKGMRYVIDQLSKAQKKQTQQQFTANAAAAFGREPLGAITALASEGAISYDKMSAAVARQGGAAAVAQSKMKGLGGAMDKLESQLEDVALGIYTTVTPALTAAVTGIASSLDGAGGKVQSFLDTAGGLGKLAFTGKVAPTISGIDPKVVAGIQTARGIIIASFQDVVTFVKTSLIPSLQNIGMAVGPLVAIIGGAFVLAVRAAAWILANGVGPALVGVTGFMRDHKGVVIGLAAVLGYLVLAYKAQQAQLLILEAGGLAKYIAATKLGVFWTNASAAAMTLQKAGLYAYRAAVFTAVVATQGWTAAQEILNIAMIANPVGLLITGIVLAVAAMAALVAGVVWAYKNLGWFRTAVDAVWTGIQVGAKAVGAAAVWLWQSVFVPVWNGIAAAATWAWSTILKPTFDGIVSVVRGVAAVFTWWWQNVTMPVFRGIAAVAGWFWNTFSAIIELAVAIVKFALAPAFQFVATVAKLAWQGIVGAVQWAWGIASAVLGVAVGFLRNTFGAAFTWLYASVVKPVFGWIALAVSTWWTGTKVVFSAVSSFLRGTLGPAFSWLYQNVVRPVFDGIRTTISVVWTTGIKPVFDKISNFAKVTIPAAFAVMKDGVKKAWDAVSSTAKAPIKFVVNTVLNDALIGNFNKVAGVFGTKKITPISLPKGFAGGGVIPGYQSAQRDDVLTPMRRGEGVLVPEVVRALGPAFIHGLNAAGNRGGAPAVRNAVGYAKGGIVGAVTSGWDWVKGTAGNAWDWTKNAAETASKVIADPVGTLGKLVKGVIGKIPGAGRMVDMAGGMASKVLTGAISLLKKMGDDDAGGAGTGKNGDIPKSSLAKVSGFAPGPGVGAMGGYLRIAAARAWEAMQKASGGALGLTEGYRDMANQQKRWAMYKAGGNLAAVPGTSVHGLGKAADINAGQAWARANGARFGWVNTGLGFSQREPWHFEYKGATTGSNGMAAGGVIGGASSALVHGVTPTLYDQGGVLPSGISLVENRTTQPEYALPHDRLVDIVGEARGESDGDGRLWRDLVVQGGDDIDKQVRGFTRAARAIKRGGPV